jgi:hypothetical protein
MARPDDRRPFRAVILPEICAELLRRARMVLGQDPQARSGCGVRCSGSSPASSRRAQSAHALAGISGVSGISIRGIKAQETVVVRQVFQDDAGSAGINYSERHVRRKT